MMNINSINFYINFCVITANLKTSSNKVAIIVPYTVDTGSDGNIMPLYTQKVLTGATKRVAGSNKKYKYPTKMYNHTTITQLGICKANKK